MNPLQTIEAIASLVREEFEHFEGSHDWWHIERVWRLARRIGEAEGADMFVVELGALLHDIADWKFHGGDTSVGPARAREIMSEHGVPESVITHVCGIIATLSYKGAGVNTDMATLEGRVVQDADRLDAIGAIGIARTFAYSGHRGRPIYDPRIPAVPHQSAADYIAGSGQSAALNHFHEKLLLLKDRMQTATGRHLAEARHEYMEGYVRQFLAEWGSNE